MPLNACSINSFTINGFCYTYDLDFLGLPDTRGGGFVSRRTGKNVSFPEPIRRRDVDWESDIQDVNHLYTSVAVTINGVEHRQTLENTLFVTPFIAVRNINTKDENVEFIFKGIETK